MDQTVTGLRKQIDACLKFSLAVDATTASKRGWWLATADAVQSMIIERMIATRRRTAKRTPSAPVPSRSSSSISRA